MLGGAMASGFSPSSLVFELEPDQEDCQTIFVSSESEMIEVSDYWAENRFDERQQGHPV